MNKLKIKVTSIVLLVLIIITSCTSKKQYPQASTGFEASREFIDACLKADFERATFYMLPTEKNNELLEEFKKKYSLKTKQQKIDLAETSIIILDNNFIDSNTLIVNYKITYDKFVSKVKAVKQEKNLWLIDFAYSQNGNL